MDFRRGLLHSEADSPDAGEPYAMRAFRLGLRFDANPEARLIALPKQGRSIAAAIRDGRTALVRKMGGNAPGLLIAPGEAETERLARAIGELESARPWLTVTTPDAIRRLLVKSCGRRLLAEAMAFLPRIDPALSARRRFSIGQWVVLALLVIGLGVAALRWGWTVAAVVNLAAGLLFSAVVVLRMLALSVVLDRAARPPPPAPQLDLRRLPVYSVLLPLYDEAHMVPDLVRAIDALDWPRDRLDVKFLIEARDHRTADAIAALKLGPPYETIIVPEGGPRTKPKALAFALPLTRGRFVTVYDAEDRPHPKQLIDAFSTFRRSDRRLACLQAPLLIADADLNGLTALYALEYAVQFDGILPTLSAFGLPLPLGGTSNHFRREALIAVGGWDPYNVTEDADLGVRLARFGYRAATIDSPTFEEAPRTARLWLGQRSRWLKGWLHTFLVHTRHPIRLWRDLGTAGVAGFVITSLGSLAAAALHPLYLATALFLVVDPVWLWRASSPLIAAMLFLSLFNFISAYLIFALLSTSAMRMRRMKRPRGALLYLPAYWLLLSVAFYRALVQFLVAPHYWAKTPHIGRRLRDRKAPPAPSPPVDASPP